MATFSATLDQTPNDDPFYQAALLTTLLNNAGLALVPAEAGEVSGRPAVSAGQVRAARAFLDMSAQSLADKAEISLLTLKRLESGQRTELASVQALHKVFERHGVTFTFGARGEAGVSKKP